ESRTQQVRDGRKGRAVVVGPPGATRLLQHPQIRPELDQWQIQHFRRLAQAPDDVVVEDGVVEWNVEAMDVDQRVDLGAVLDDRIERVDAAGEEARGTPVRFRSCALRLPGPN